MILRDHLRGARERLVAAGVDPEEAALDAEILARDVLEVDRARLIASLTDAAPTEFAAAFDALIARRAAREPIAYIRGRQEFWGRDFTVGPGVLIPRPETELIIEEALTTPFRRALDIGTGSGCLAITLALECLGNPEGLPLQVHALGNPEGLPLQAPVEATLPPSQMLRRTAVALAEAGQGCLIVATDVSEAALAIARENANRLLDSRIRHRIEFRHGAYAAGAQGPFDLIVSNPPYVTTMEYAGLQAEVRGYEPATALVAGEDGLDVIREIVRLAPRLLAPGGRLVIEIGYGQADAVRSIIGAQRGLTLVRIREDLQGIPRVAVITSG